MSAPSEEGSRDSSFGIPPPESEGTAFTVQPEQSVPSRTEKEVQIHSAQSREKAEEGSENVELGLQELFPAVARIGERMLAVHRDWFALPAMGLDHPKGAPPLLARHERVAGERFGAGNTHGVHLPPGRHLV